MPPSEPLHKLRLQARARSTAAWSACCSVLCRELLGVHAARSSVESCPCRPSCPVDQPVARPLRPARSSKSRQASIGCCWCAPQRQHVLLWWQVTAAGTPRGKDASQLYTHLCFESHDNTQHLHHKSRARRALEIVGIRDAPFAAIDEITQPAVARRWSRCWRTCGSRLSTSPAPSWRTPPAWSRRCARP